MRHPAIHMEAFDLTSRIGIAKTASFSVGQTLRGVNFTLEKTAIESYVEAVQDPAQLFKQNGLVPTLAIAAIAKNRLMESLNIPDGAIQSQANFDFISEVKLGEILHCQGTISEHWIRNGIHFVGVDIRVKKTNRKCVLKGKMGFILAPLAGGK
jgi:hypothetical protein